MWGFWRFNIYSPLLPSSPPGITSRFKKLFSFSKKNSHEKSSRYSLPLLPVQTKLRRQRKKVSEIKKKSGGRGVGGRCGIIKQKMQISFWKFLSGRRHLGLLRNGVVSPSPFLPFISIQLFYPFAPPPPPRAVPVEFMSFLNLSHLLVHSRLERLLTFFI